jgi:hypothetical protein
MPKGLKVDDFFGSSLFSAPASDRLLVQELGLL